MKKKSILLLFLFISTTTSVFSVYAWANGPTTSQAGRTSFVWGWGNVLGDWDPAIFRTSELDHIRMVALERLVWQDVSGDPREFLATDWTYHARPDEGNMTGGVKAISFNLRPNVYFQDGSEFNASVVKWNFDRLTSISGNQTGTGDLLWKGSYWFDPSGMTSRFTTDWNVSWYQYDLFGLGDFIPRINETIVVSNYVVNFTFNTWSTDVTSFSAPSIISMESYLPWTGEPMIGYGNDPAFPQDDPGTYPGHMIGTGPYKFVEADELVTRTITGIKNENYWNKTALEAAGLFVIDDLYVRMFADGATRTNALLTGDLDVTGHMLQNPITDKDAVEADPLLDFYNTVLQPDIDAVTFLCTEGTNTNLTTGMAAGMTPREAYPIYHGEEMAPGVNRTVRLALSWAWDYEGYANVFYGPGGGSVTHSPLGSQNIWLDPSVPYPTLNYTKAREILLSDPYYLAQCTARNLDINNETADWIHVADTNPIQVFSSLWSQASEKPQFIAEACNALGFSLTIRRVTNIFQDWIIAFKTPQYDMFTMIWPMHITNPVQDLERWFLSTVRSTAWGGLNMAHLDNSSIDQIINDLPFAGAGSQALYTEIADQLHNYHAPWIFCGQGQLGLAINTGWEFTQDALEFPGPSGGNSGLMYAWIGGARETITTPTAPAEISGYPLAIISFFTMLSIVGSVYIIMKKRRKI